MVFEKPALVEREVVDPDRDIVDEAKELPRAWPLVAPAAGRETDADFFGSGRLVVFGRVALGLCQYPLFHIRWCGVSHTGNARGFIGDGPRRQDA